MQEYYALDKDDGLTMSIGSNPFIQFSDKEQRKKVMEVLLEQISLIQYVPFESTTIGNPALDLGDVLVFSGGHADEGKFSCVTSYQCNMNGKYQMKCIGKNPRLMYTKSKMEKSLTGILSKVDASRMIFYTYTNASTFNINSLPIQVIRIYFTTQEETSVEFKATILLDVTATDTISAIKAQYYMDETLLNFSPVETYQTGKHCFNLYYPFVTTNLKENANAPHLISRNSR